MPWTFVEVSSLRYRNISNEWQAKFTITNGTENRAVIFTISGASQPSNPELVALAQERLNQINTYQAFIDEINNPGKIDWSSLTQQEKTILTNFPIALFKVYQLVNDNVKPIVKDVYDAYLILKDKLIPEEE